jgi:ATP-binding cassette subfamily B protein RaxB
MIECAQIAGIHDEIMAMPMTYNSLIGDMGSSLSSGQKQRVLLARALYRQPKILFLDEGTAHLDVEKEREINSRLRMLQMTRISVAHRPEMMSGADRVLRIGGTAAVIPPSRSPPADDRKTGPAFMRRVAAGRKEPRAWHAPVPRRAIRRKQAPQIDSRGAMSAARCTV